MGLLDKLRDIRDRDKPTLDELSPFADEEPDVPVQPDGDDRIHADGGNTPA